MIFISFESFYVLVGHRESIIPGNLGFAIGVGRVRERGRMSKSVYVCVFSMTLNYSDMCNSILRYKCVNA